MNRKFLFVLIAGLIGALGLVGLGCEMCCNSSQGQGSIVINDQAVMNSQAATRGQAAIKSQASNEPHKATFSYRVECIGSYADPDIDPAAVRKVTGRLEYQDHRPWKNGGGNVLSVSIHGEVGDVSKTFDGVCSQNQNIAIFTGIYTPQPKTLGEGGVFTVSVEDKGKTGPSPEDTFSMKLEGGVFDLYEVSGALAGGNLKPL